MGFAEAIAGIGTWISSLSAASAATYAGVAAAVVLGATAYSNSDSAAATSAMSLDKVDQPLDKTTPQQKDELDAAQLGDVESEKRKRKGAKGKFKIQRDAAVDTKPETGVAIDSPTKTTGVQI